MKRTLLMIALALTIAIPIFSQWDVGQKINKGMEWTPTYVLIGASVATKIVDGDPFACDLLIYHENTNYRLFTSSASNVYTTYTSTWSGGCIINDANQGYAVIGFPLRAYRYLTTDGGFSGPVYGRMEAGASSTTVYAIKLRKRN